MLSRAKAQQFLVGLVEVLVLSRPGLVWIGSYQNLDPLLPHEGGVVGGFTDPDHSAHAVLLQLLWLKPVRVTFCPKDLDP